MRHRLDSDILENSKQYFFSLLGPRFESLNGTMARSLEKRFGGEFVPIYIYSIQPNQYFAPSNYLILNPQAEEMQHALKDTVIFPQEYEDMNLEFTSSPFIKKLIDDLSKKQKHIFVYAFTSSCMDNLDPRLTLLGPRPRVSKKYDNKIDQYELFSRLDLPRNEARIFETREEVYKNLSSVIPSYISAAYTSGGNESGLILDKEGLENFFSRLRKVNADERFLVSRIFEKLETAPNATALVTPEKTYVLAITDQILRDNSYLGNVYPSKISNEHRDLIITITERVGNELAKEGFAGLFGLDFLIDVDGHIVTVDLNPRRQGGYACLTWSLKSVGVELTDLELSCAIGESVTSDLSYDAIQYSGAWAHSKVKPYYTGSRIQKEMREGSLAAVFMGTQDQFCGLFYENETLFIQGYIGYVVTSGKNRNEVLEKTMNKAEELLEEGLG